MQQNLERYPVLRFRLNKQFYKSLRNNWNMHNNALMFQLIESLVQNFLREFFFFFCNWRGVKWESHLSLDSPKYFSAFEYLELPSK